MGIDYSFDVYVHRRAAGRLLTEVAALCDRRVEQARTTVVPPEGPPVVLPGTVGFESGRTVELAATEYPSFDLSLCFPPDEPLRAYRDGDLDTYGTTRIMVGYVYLTVFDAARLLPGHLQFSFTPASGVQSRLFLSSPSIRETFASLASSLCLFDVEQDYHIVVTAGHHRVSTQVPGPCLLWHRGGPDDRAYRELLARLEGRPASTPGLIIGPEHPAYATFAADLARHSQVSGTIL